MVEVALLILYFKIGTLYKRLLLGCRVVLYSFWLIGGMPKSLCNHELSVIIVVIIICGQLNQLIWLSLKN